MAQVATSRVLSIDLHFYLYQWAKDNLIAVFFACSTTDDQARQHRTLKQTYDRAHTVAGRTSEKVLLLDQEENYK